MSINIPSIAILAGGIATRLYPLTKKVPKAMLELNGKPFIYHQLKLLKTKGITRVVLCVQYLGEEIKKFVKDGKNFDLTVKYSFDGEKFLGTGGAINKALPLLDDPFFVMYGDSYLDINYQSIFDYFKSNDKPGLMTVIKNDNKWDKSNIAFESGKIIEYNKKKRTPAMKYIDYGLGVLRKNVFDCFEENESFDLEEVYKKLVKKGEMSGYEIKNRFYEIGSFKGLKETGEYIKKNRNL